MLLNAAHCLKFGCLWGGDCDRDWSNYVVGLHIAVFTRGSWVNPGYGGCKGLRQGPLAPRPIWKGRHICMSGIGMPLRCGQDAQIFVSMSRFFPSSCIDADICVYDVAAEEDSRTRTHIGRGMHAQRLGVRGHNRKPSTRFSGPHTGLMLFPHVLNMCNPSGRTIIARPFLWSSCITRMTTSYQYLFGKHKTVVNNMSFIERTWWHCAII